MSDYGSGESEMTAARPDSNDQLICTRDAHDVDRLLAKLIAVHREPRYDIAPELRAPARLDDKIPA